MLLAYVGFVVQGLPDGILGIAWPSIRESFHVSLDRFGEILTASTVGYFIASFNSGRIVSGIGFGWFLTLGSFITSMGLLGYCLSPSWIVMVAFGVLVGIGSGAVDSGLNAYFATNYTTRDLNWLHASFGLGTTLGPAIAISLFNIGLSWRWAYLVPFLAQGLLAVCLLLTFVHWEKLRGAKRLDEVELRPAGVRCRDTLKMPVVWYSIGLFLFIRASK